MEQPVAAEEGKKSVRTRARILDSAAQALAAKGYAATRLSDIAKIAAVQAPAIYYYFDSKDDLVEEVLRIGSARTREHVQERLDRLDATATPLDRIDIAVAAHLEMLLQLSHFATAAIRNAGHVPEPVQAVQRREEQRYVALWRQLLTEAQSAGLIAASIDTGIAQMLILGALNTAPQGWSSERGTIDQLVETAQSFVRGSLGAATSASATAHSGT